MRGVGFGDVVWRLRVALVMRVTIGNEIGSHEIFRVLSRQISLHIPLPLDVGHDHSGQALFGKCATLSIHPQAPQSTVSGIPVQFHSIRRLFPFETLRHLDRPPFEPVLQGVPIDAFVNGIAVRSGVFMIENPIERHDGRVELAHEILSNVIDTVLVVPLIYLRDLRF